MSVVALDATTSHPSSARLRAVPSDRPLDEAPVATSQTDTTVTVVAVVFAVLDGAYGLAAVVADYLDDADLREQVRADFESEGGVIDVEAMFRSM